MVHAFNDYIGITSNNIVKCYALLRDLMAASQRQYGKIIIQPDSSIVLQGEAIRKMNNIHLQ